MHVTLPSSFALVFTPLRFHCWQHFCCMVPKNIHNKIYIFFWLKFCHVLFYFRNVYIKSQRMLPAFWLFESAICVCVCVCMSLRVYVNVVVWSRWHWTVCFVHIKLGMCVSECDNLTEILWHFNDFYCVCAWLACSLFSIAVGNFGISQTWRKHQEFSASKHLFVKNT